MFEKASRMKLRFDFRGSISVEDLWDLSLKELDGIFKNLNKSLKSQSEESLLDVKTPEDDIINLKVDIVKHIVMVKRMEAESSRTAIIRKQERDKIREILANKKDSDLLNKSPEELQKMLDDLA